MRQASAASERTGEFQPLFPHLSDEMMQRLVQYGEETDVEAGELLFRRGARSVDLFIVLDGELVVFEYGIDRTRKTVVTLGRGQFTGEQDLLNNRATLLDCVATVRSKVLRIQRSDLQTLMRTEPDIAEIVMHTCISRRSGLVLHSQGGVVLVSRRDSPDGMRLERFLLRNGYPHRQLDPDTDSETKGLLRSLGIGNESLPIAVLPDLRILRNPSIIALAEELGLTEPVDTTEVCDVLIVGAGPAGLAAAVYAASEGLTTTVIEGNAPGGQAGNSSKIENYLGFPTGVSGQELADRAQVQAQKFGARLSISREVTGLEQQDGRYRLSLEGGKSIVGRSVLIATGARYRKLDVPNYGHFEGRGIHYAATPMEASFCRNQEVVVVGAGNSAGQAAVFLSQTASHVHLIFRGETLEASMSAYLIQRIKASKKITVYASSAISHLEGSPSLSHASWTDLSIGSAKSLAIRHVFVMIGAVPNTRWLDGSVELDETGFVLTGASAQESDSVYATTLPGVFAVGDVRSGSVKRVASAAGDGAAVIADVHRYLAALRSQEELSQYRPLAELGCIQPKYAQEVL